MDIHFSIDDVIGAFDWLERTQADSIYDSFVFSNLRNIHNEFGIPMDAYCICETSTKNLHSVSDKWKDEFMQAEEWLKFGFHAFSDVSDYSNQTGKRVETEYRIFKSEIARITGHKQLSDTIRLHYFSGNGSVTRALRKCGVKYLLTADDDRISYGLEPENIRHINSNGNWNDVSSDIGFIKTDFRIENVLNMNCTEIANLLHDKNRICFFTHERLLSDARVIGKIYEILHGTIKEK